MKADEKKNPEISRALQKKESPRLIAKKSFVISHNDYHRMINEGDDISDVPPLYHRNLKTEEVI